MRYLLLILLFCTIQYSQQQIQLQAQSSQDDIINQGWFSGVKTEKYLLNSFLRPLVYPRDTVVNVGAREQHIEGPEIAVQQPGFQDLNQAGGVATLLFQNTKINLLRYTGALNYGKPQNVTASQLVNSTLNLLTPQGGDTCYSSVQFLMPCDLLTQLFDEKSGELEKVRNLPFFDKAQPDVVDTNTNNIIWYLDRATDNSNSACTNMTFTCSQDQALWQYDQSGDLQSIDQLYSLLKTYTKSYNDQLMSLSTSGFHNFTPSNQDTLSIQRPIELVGQGDSQLQLPAQSLQQKNPLMSVEKGGMLVFKQQNIKSASLSSVNTTMNCLDINRYPDLNGGCYRYDLGFPVVWNISYPYCQVVVQDSQVEASSCDALDKFQGYIRQVPNDTNPDTIQQRTPISQLNRRSRPGSLVVDFVRMEGFCIINSTFTCSNDPGQTSTQDDVVASAAQWGSYGRFLQQNSTAPQSKQSQRMQKFRERGRWVVLAIGLFLFIKCCVGLGFYLYARQMRSKVRKANDLRDLEENKIKRYGSSQNSSERIVAGHMPNSMNNSLTSSDGSQTNTNSAHQNILRKIQSLVDEIRMQKLQILEKIGQGAFGIVYKGVWNHEQVAVKEILLGQGTKEVESAVLEAAITTSIQHVNLVQCKAYSLQTIPSQPQPIQEDDETKEENDQKNSAEAKQIVQNGNGQDIFKLYLIQEYCDLGPLTSQLRKRAFFNVQKQQPNFYIITSIALDIAQGCNHIHHNNVIHGDLKSNNVLLKTAENQLGMTSKITDFGLSVRLNEQQSVVSGHMAGTPFYVAPEVIAQGQISKKSDVFSFGVLLWELFNSQIVYMNNKASNEIFPQFSPICPMGYLFLTGLCISPMPDDRPNFDQIVEVLKLMRNAVAMGSIKVGEHNSQENMTLADKSTPVTFNGVRDWVKNYDGASSKSGTQPQIEQLAFSSGNDVTNVTDSNVAQGSGGYNNNSSTNSVLVNSPEGKLRMTADFNGSNPTYSRSHVKLQSHGKSNTKQQTFSYTTVQQLFIKDSLRFDSNSFHTALNGSASQNNVGNPQLKNQMAIVKSFGGTPMLPLASSNSEKQQEGTDDNDLEQVDKQPLELTVVFDKQTKKIDFFWRMINFTPSQDTTDQEARTTDSRSPATKTPDTKEEED